MLDALSPGQVLDKRYELLMPVAQGGMASVWAARVKGSRGFQKMVAIKTMLPNMVDDPHFQKMFEEEASLASKVHHPHVVETMDLGEDGAVLFQVMEWVDGEPLSLILKYAATRGGLPLSIAVLLATQACRGLHAAHELRDENGILVGLVHRDVSPQNVLVTYDGVVKLVDFGVAKATARAAASQTEAGQLKGKIAYMSPEQLRGDKIDRRSDIFAMGILLYMMTTGKHPFRGEDQADTVDNIGSDDPVIAPSELVPGFPHALELVIFQALAKDPAKRYPTANDMLIALSRCLPPSMRAATDEEVAEFLRRLLPDRFEKRKLAIKSALEAADRRQAGVPVKLNENQDEAVTVFEGLVSNRESVPDHDVSLPGAASSRPPRMGIDDWRARERRRTALGVAGVFFGIAGLVVLAAMLFRPKAPAAGPPSAAPEISTVTPLTAPAAPAAPAPTPSVSAPPEASSAPPAASAKPPPQAPRPPGKRAKPSSKPPPKKTGSDTFVSPIRTPGF
jgi:eukaryotic-like serine/threonine-protein kinase